MFQFVDGTEHNSSFYAYYGRANIRKLHIYKYMYLYTDRQTDGEFKNSCLCNLTPWNPNTSGENSMLHVWVWMLFTRQTAKHFGSLRVYDPTSCSEDPSGSRRSKF